jgi:hypothetical protein
MSKLHHPNTISNLKQYMSPMRPIERNCGLMQHHQMYLTPIKKEKYKAKRFHKRSRPINPKPLMQNFGLKKAIPSMNRTDTMKQLSFVTESYCLIHNLLLPGSTKTTPFTCKAIMTRSLPHSIRLLRSIRKMQSHGTAEA